LSRSRELGGALNSSLRWIAPLTWVLSLLTAFYLLLPILIIFPISVSNSMFLTWPPRLFSWRWFESFFTEPDWIDALLQSLKLAIPVVLISTLLGTLAAIGLAYVRGPMRRLLQTLFIAPQILPVITYSLGLFEISSRLRLSGSILPVVLGQSMLATPLVFILVSAGLAGRDRQLPLAAASMGAGASKILWTVELPLLRASITAAALMAFVISFDETVLAYFLLPPGSFTLPVQMMSATRDSVEPTIAAASVIVIAIVATIAVAFAVVRTILDTRKK
jgi:putative spermidine/putrescine transport system permease protein